MIDFNGGGTVAIRAFFTKMKGEEGFLARVVVKELALSLLWLGFDPWPQEIPHAKGAAKKKKKKKKGAGFQVQLQEVNYSQQRKLNT